MSVLLAILGILFVALVVIVPLVEKYGKKHSEEEMKKLSRFFLPLIAVLLLVQLFAYFFF